VYKRGEKTMATLNISIPEPLREFVERQVAEGGHGDASEYIHKLLREEQKKRAKEKVEALLLEGLQSGPATEMTAQDWEDIRREVHERHARRHVQ
jgi:antitoxin ParD1/3/4